MKLNVPFYKSKTDTDCGPLALKMVLSYFDEDYSFEELAKLEKQLDAGFVWSTGIALAANKLGFRVKFISKTNFNPEETDLKYYQEHYDEQARNVLNELREELKEKDIEVQKDMSLSELLSYVSKDSIVIIALNWNIVTGKDGFCGHFVPITGYDDENIYVHNPGIASAMPYLAIKRDLFLKSWESKGTDKDTVIIYRKS